MVTVSTTSTSNPSPPTINPLSSDNENKNKTYDKNKEQKVSELNTNAVNANIKCTEQETEHDKNAVNANVVSTVKSKDKPSFARTNEKETQYKLPTQIRCIPIHEIPDMETNAFDPYYKKIKGIDPKENPLWRTRDYETALNHLKVTSFTHYTRGGVVVTGMCEEQLEESDQDEHELLLNTVDRLNLDVNVFSAKNVIVHKAGAKRVTFQGHYHEVKTYYIDKTFWPHTTIRSVPFITYWPLNLKDKFYRNSERNPKLRAIDKRYHKWFVDRGYWSKSKFKFAGKWWKFYCKRKCFGMLKLLYAKRCQTKSICALNVEALEFVPKTTTVVKEHGKFDCTVYDKYCEYMEQRLIATVDLDVCDTNMRSMPKQVKIDIDINYTLNLPLNIKVVNFLHDGGANTLVTTGPVGNRRRITGSISGWDKTPKEMTMYVGTLGVFKNALQIRDSKQIVVPAAVRKILNLPTTWLTHESLPCQICVVNAILPGETRSRTHVISVCGEMTDGIEYCTLTLMKLLNITIENYDVVRDISIDSDKGLVELSISGLSETICAEHAVNVSKFENRFVHGNEIDLLSAVLGGAAVDTMKCFKRNGTLQGLEDIPWSTFTEAANLNDISRLKANYQRFKRLPQSLRVKLGFANVCPGQVWLIDFVFFHTESGTAATNFKVFGGYRGVLLAVDYRTSYPLIAPMKAQTAERYKEALSSLLVQINNLVRRASVDTGGAAKPVRLLVLDQHKVQTEAVLRPVLDKFDKKIKILSARIDSEDMSILNRTSDIIFCMTRYWLKWAYMEKRWMLSAMYHAMIVYPKRPKAVKGKNRGKGYSPYTQMYRVATSVSNMPLPWGCSCVYNRSVKSKHGNSADGIIVGIDMYGKQFTIYNPVLGRGANVKRKRLIAFLGKPPAERLRYLIHGIPVFKESSMLSEMPSFNLHDFQQIPWLRNEDANYLYQYIESGMVNGLAETAGTFKCTCLKYVAKTLEQLTKHVNKSRRANKANKGDPLYVKHPEPTNLPTRAQQKIDKVKEKYDSITSYSNEITQKLMEKSLIESQDIMFSLGPLSNTGFMHENQILESDLVVDESETIRAKPFEPETKESVPKASANPVVTENKESAPNVSAKQTKLNKWAALPKRIKSSRKRSDIIKFDPSVNSCELFRTFDLHHTYTSEILDDFGKKDVLEVNRIVNNIDLFGYDQHIGVEDESCKSSGEILTGNWLPDTTSNDVNAFRVRLQELQKDKDFMDALEEQDEMHKATQYYVDKSMDVRGISGIGISFDRGVEQKMNVQDDLGEESRWDTTAIDDRKSEQNDRHEIDTMEFTWKSNEYIDGDGNDILGTFWKNSEDVQASINSMVHMEYNALDKMIRDSEKMIGGEKLVGDESGYDLCPSTIPMFQPVSINTLLLEENPKWKGKPLWRMKDTEHQKYDGSDHLNFTLPLAEINLADVHLVPSVMTGLKNLENSDCKTAFNKITGANRASFIAHNSRSALNSPLAPHYIVAMIKECASLTALGAFELVELKEIPKGKRIISTRFVYDIKYDPINKKVERFKARLVALGCQQQLYNDVLGIGSYDPLSTSSPVVKDSSVRALLTTAALAGLEVETFDIGTAFLTAKLSVDGSEDIYLRLPPCCTVTESKVVMHPMVVNCVQRNDIHEQSEHTSEINNLDKKVDKPVKTKYKKGKHSNNVNRKQRKRKQQGTVVHAVKALYGLRNSSAAFYRKISSVLKSMGFKQSEEDMCVFTKNTIILCIHVDDLLVCGVAEELKNFKITITEHFEGIGSNIKQGSASDEGGVKFLGSIIKKKDGYITLNQSERINDLCENFGIDKAKLVRSPVRIPYVAEHVKKWTEVESMAVTTEQQKETVKLVNQLHGDVVNYEGVIRKFREYTGNLIWLCGSACLTTLPTVYKLARYQNTPGFLHIMAARKVLEYIYCNKDREIIFGRQRVNYKNITKMTDQDRDRHDVFRNALSIFTDTIHADCQVTRRSTGGYCTFLFGSILSIKSFRLSCVTTSTTQSEYYMMSHAAAETIYFMEFCQY